MIENEFSSIVLRLFLLLGASTLSLPLFAEAEPSDEAKVVDADAVEEAQLRVAAHKAVDAAIPLAEKDPTRPIYHFRPPAQWMNDICGAIFYKGYYHIFKDGNGRRVMVGWVCGFKPKRGWNGCMSLPRVLTLGIVKK